MTTGYTTPLLELFKRGDVDRDVRLLAARGGVAPRAAEQLALLLLLENDPDPEVAAEAGRTVAAIPREALAGFLARSDTPTDLKRHFTERGVQPAAQPSGDGTQPLIEVEDAAGQEAPTSPEAHDRDKPLALYSIMERVKLAVRGSREQRAVLIRDSNKMVAIAVLSSPKLTDSEVENFARMGTVAVDVLRAIASNRSWLKNYGVTSALAKNPRTPPAISLRLLPQLNVRDIRLLAMDRNVPDAVRIAARKFVNTSESRRQ